MDYGVASLQGGPGYSVFDRDNSHRQAGSCTKYTWYLHRHCPPRSRRGSRPLYAMQRPAMDGVLHLNLLVPTQVLRRGLVDAPGGSIRALGQ